MRRKFCILSPQRRSKRPKPAGNADFFKITDHLKPPTVAKRCTFLESRKSPALRGFVAGRRALATTSLYPSTKIGRPQTARKGAHGGVLSLNLNGPDSLRPTRGPTLSKYPRQEPPPPPLPRNQHTGPTRPRQGAFPWSSGSPPGVGAGCARKCARLPLAASQVLCLPHPRVGGIPRTLVCSKQAEPRQAELLVLH